jgi:hypothetical protein
MADVHVQIEFDDSSQGNQGKALAELGQRFPDLYLRGRGGWWRKPPDNARSLVARVLSKHGCRGRLSVQPHDGKAPWDSAPAPVWSGFVPKP